MGCLTPLSLGIMKVFCYLLVIILRPALMGEAEVAEPHFPLDYYVYFNGQVVL